MRHLETTRGFIIRRNPPFKNSVVKNIPPGGEIIIDFIPKNHSNNFEGREDNCPLNLLNGRIMVKVMLTLCSLVNLRAFPES